MKKFFIWKIIYSKSYIQISAFKILKNLTEKSYGAFKIWRGKKIQKISNYGQTMVKLIILEY
jgi:hypothetical protein